MKSCVLAEFSSYFWQKARSRSLCHTAFAFPGGTLHTLSPNLGEFPLRKQRGLRPPHNLLGCKASSNDRQLLISQLGRVIENLELLFGV